MSAAQPSRSAPPVAVRLPAAEWAKRNLFNRWYNSALTVVFAVVAAVVVVRATRFAFVSGRWEIVRINLANLLVGLYPRDQLWRVWLAAYVIAATAALTASAASNDRGDNGDDGENGSAGSDHSDGSEPRSAEPGSPAQTLGRVLRRSWPALVLSGVLIGLSPSISAVVLTAGLGVVAAAAFRLGSAAGHRARRFLPLAGGAGFVGAVGALSWGGGVGWDRWGGLLLTLFLAVAGIVASFPLGLLLALGRRSSFPAIRALCVGYIELIRGVPLITLLFMGAFAIGFLFPPGTSRPSLVTRGLIALILFTAAYIAEIVRGGLQSVPKGQIEAGLAVGLSPVRVTVFIVLPQALRAVIPAVVGQFISLFKDTSLFAVIGLTELLRVGQTITSQPRFLAQGLHAETLLFVSLIYWVGSYSMSKESQRLERRLGVGTR